MNEDDAPELPQEATTREGDLFVMGSHRLLCGNATKKGTYQRLMDAYQADIVVTDPRHTKNVSLAAKQNRPALVIH